MAVYYSVFISHNIDETNEKILETLENRIPGYISLYIAEHDLQPGKKLSNKIESAIRDSDAMIVILTSNGSSSAWINQEIGFAQSEGKLIIPLVEKGVKTKAFIEGVEWIELDPENPDAASKEVKKVLDKKVKQRIKEIREKEGFLISVAIGVVLIITIIVTAFLLTRGRKK